MSIGRVMFAALAVCVAGGIFYALSGPGRDGPAPKAQSAANAEQSTSTQPGGVTGLPLPRFVSLKSERVNVRRGPSSDHEVAWVFKRKSLPVEVVAEYDHWRRIRDSDGAEGWVYHSLIAGRRTVLASPWEKKQTINLMNGTNADASPVAMVNSGAVGTLLSCDGKWCRVGFGDYEGYVLQTQLFVVNPNETYSK